MDRSTFLARLHSRIQLPLSALNDFVQRITGSPVASLERLVRGDENEVYRISLCSGSTVFVRAAFPDHPLATMSAQADVMQRAREAGVPVPAVHAVEMLRTHQGNRATMILEEASGTQLSQVLPQLSAAERATVLQNVGRLLGRLENVRLPGSGRPDAHGRWPDPIIDRRRYLTAVRADSQLLDQAGLTGNEIRQIHNILHSRVAMEIFDGPILTHGDISAEHLFIDGEQSVTALIDWGMWSGGSTADELAALAMKIDSADFATVLAHHPTAAQNISELRPRLAISMLTRGIGELAWLLRSGQSDRHRQIATIRQAINDLQSAT